MNGVSIATLWNLDALEDAFRRWRQDPASVDESWRLFFEGFELGALRGDVNLDLEAQTNLVRLIDAYRDLGHFLAHLDPLSDPPTAYPLLELAEFGLSAADLPRSFDTSHF